METSLVFLQCLQISKLGVRPHSASEQGPWKLPGPVGQVGTHSDNRAGSS